MMDSAANSKYDWYQTEAEVVVTVLEKNVVVGSCRVEFGDGRRLELVGEKSNGAAVVLLLALAHPIQPKASIFKCTPAKVEIKMKKFGAGRWESLGASEHGDRDALKNVQAYPTSSIQTHRNWDKLEKQVKEEEEKEELDGDAAVNRLFQKIYADASDDVKKAMIKSFTESKGTCLSTNWDDVKKQPVECKPPDGMEFKPS